MRLLYFSAEQRVAVEHADQRHKQPNQHLHQNVVRLPPVLEPLFAADRPDQDRNRCRQQQQRHRQPQLSLPENLPQRKPK